MLKAIAGKVYRLGDESGPGSVVKMVNQLLAGVHIAAAGEAMALAIRSGADPDRTYEVIANSAGSSWMFQNRVPHILAGDYTPLSAVNIFVKDLGIVLDYAKKQRVPVAACLHRAPDVHAGFRRRTRRRGRFRGGKDLPRYRAPRREADMKPLLGCIADDFTGGTDLAGMLVRGRHAHGADDRRAARPSAAATSMRW